MGEFYDFYRQKGGIDIVKTGLVLSGGGSRAMAQVGFLQALEERGVVIDSLCGVSAGAIVATLYAAGMTPAEIKTALQKQRYSRYFSLRGGGGLFSIRKGVDALHELLPVHAIESLPKKLKIAVLNLDEGVLEIKAEGDAAFWTCASSAIPGLIAPFMHEGVRYADGGVLNNLPAFALEGEVDYLIGYNVNPLVQERKNRWMRNGIRALFLMLYTNMQEGIRCCDCYVEAHGVERHSIFSPKSFDACFAIGYQQGLAVKLPEEITDECA